MAGNNGIGAYAQSSQLLDVETTLLFSKKPQPSSPHFLSNFWHSIDEHISPVFYSTTSTPQTGPSSSRAITSKGKAKPNDPTSAVQLVLTNSESVVRDHLASERTFLAYTRTSLALASAGVALIQFLRINNTPQIIGDSLGAAAICSGLLVLAVGTIRYFTIQKALPNGVFPAARIGITVVSFCIGALITVVFGILMADRLGGK